MITIFSIDIAEDCLQKSVMWQRDVVPSARNTFTCQMKRGLTPSVCAFSAKQVGIADAIRKCEVTACKMSNLMPV